MSLGDIRIGSRRMPRGSRTKFGIYSASISAQKVLRGKSVRLYFEGICDKSRLRGEVIPKIREHVQSGRNLCFPLVVISYISKAPTPGRWLTGQQREPDRKSQRFVFLIDKEYQVIGLADDGTITPRE